MYIPTHINIYIQYIYMCVHMCVYLCICTALLRYCTNHHHNKCFSKLQILAYFEYYELDDKWQYMFMCVYVCVCVFLKAENNYVNHSHTFYINALK